MRSTFAQRERDDIFEDLIRPSNLQLSLFFVIVHFPFFLVSGSSSLFW